MPCEPNTFRANQGNFQRSTHGLAVRSHDSRLLQRYGASARPLNLSGVCNGLVGGLLLSTVLPALAQPPVASTASGRVAPGGLLPGARAMDIEMGAYRSDAPAAAADPLLSVPVANLATDAAASICALSPRRCGIALAAGATAVTLAGAAGFAVNLLLNDDTGAAITDPATVSDNEAPATRPEQGERPTTPRYSLDAHALDSRLSPSAFNASELDPTRSPCRSLGAHVNARWQETTVLDERRTRLGVFDQLRDRSLWVRKQLAEQIVALPDPDAAEKIIGDLWATGMDQHAIEAEGIAPLRPELDAIAGLPDRQALLDHLFSRAAVGRNPVFEFTAMPDLDDPSVHIAYLGQAGLGLPDSAWYRDPARNETVEAYRAYIQRTLELTGMPADTAATSALAVLSLERELAAASEPFAVLATEVAQYHNPVDVEKARAETPGIDWQAFFQAQGLDVPERFSLGMPGFFRRLDQLLANAPLQAWKDYLRFHALDRAAPCLGTRFAANHAEFHDVVLKGRRAEVPRWARVLDIIERSAGEAFSPMYAQVAFPARAARRMEEMRVVLSDALQQRLRRNPWMEATTREQAVRKAATLKVEFGHPRHWPEWEGIATDRRSFLRNVQVADAHAHRRNIALVGQPVEGRGWKMTAQTADAYQDLSQNRIVLPAALLQPPLFDPDADDALNFGGIGIVIGHEMAHGFDSLGSMFDAGGRMRDWWSPQDRQRFNALAARLAGQFSQYEVAGAKVDGELTLDENLADLGGMAIALDALRRATEGIPDPMVDGMSREQRFFANFAFSWREIATPERAALDLATDTHVPGSVRADGAPSNMPAFARAFNCSPGDPMARRPGEQVYFL